MRQVMEPINDKKRSNQSMKVLKKKPNHNCECLCLIWPWLQLWFPSESNWWQLRHRRNVHQSRWNRWIYRSTGMEWVAQSFWPTLDTRHLPTVSIFESTNQVSFFFSFFKKKKLVATYHWIQVHLYWDNIHTW